MDMNINKTDRNGVICSKNEYEYLTRCKILVDSIFKEMYENCTGMYVHMRLNQKIFEAIFPKELKEIKDYYKNECGKEIEFSDF